MVFVLLFGVHCLFSCVLSTVSIQPQFLLAQGGSECGKTRPSSGAPVMQKVRLTRTSSIKMAKWASRDTRLPLSNNREDTVLNESITALKSKRGKDSSVSPQEVKPRITIRPSYSNS